MGIIAGHPPVCITAAGKAKGGKLPSEVIRVHLREVRPLVRKIVEGEDRRDGADRHASAAIDAFHWIDVQHRFRLEFGIVLLGMNAIDRAGVHARRVFHADTGFRNHIGHRLISLRPEADFKQLTSATAPGNF